MKILHTFCFVLGFLAAASQAQAGTLYAATAAGAPGELYIINQATGAMVQDVGPLNDALSTNYPITGLAFSPITGVLYGSTGNNGAVDARLVSINPATALVTDIGPFNAGPVNSGGTPATMADIAFDSSGNLYGVGSIGGPQLYSINTLTGQATVIGWTGIDVDDRRRLGDQFCRCLLRHSNGEPLRNVQFGELAPTPISQTRRNQSAALTAHWTSMEASCTG